MFAFVSHRTALGGKRGGPAVVLARFGSAGTAYVRCFRET